MYLLSASCYNAAMSVLLPALAALLGLAALALFLRERQQARRFRDRVSERLEERAQRRMPPAP